MDHGTHRKYKPRSLTLCMRPQIANGFSMARRGTKPKPAALKLLAGNPGKRRIRPEPSAPSGEPPMPTRLLVEPLAVAKWKELVPLLLGIGTLTTGDGEALALLCEVHAAAQQALLELRASGPVLHTDTALKANPAGPLFRSLAALQQSLMAEFGLTPSSRVRLAAKEATAKDDLAEFLGTG